MKIYRQHWIINLGNQTRKMMTQYRFSTPLIKITMILTKVCVDISDLVLCLWYRVRYSMVQSPSWEANWFAASQEIPRISQNPKVHYRTHKCPPPVPTLGQPNPVHITTSHLLEIHPNLIHPSMPRSPQWSPSLPFPQQDPVHPHLLTHTCHMPTLAYSHFNSDVKMTNMLHSTTVRLCPGVSKLLVYSQQKCIYFGILQSAAMAYPKFLVPFTQFLPHRKHSTHYNNKLVNAVHGNAVYKKVR